MGTWAVSASSVASVAVQYDDVTLAWTSLSIVNNGSVDEVVVTMTAPLEIGPDRSVRVGPGLTRNVALAPGLAFVTRAMMEKDGQLHTGRACAFEDFILMTRLPLS